MSVLCDANEEASSVRKEGLESNVTSLAEAVLHRNILCPININTISLAMERVLIDRISHHALLVSV